MASKSRRPPSSFHPFSCFPGKNLPPLRRSKRIAAAASMKKVANPAKTTKAEPAKKRQPIKKTQATKKSHPTKKAKKAKKVWLPAVAPEKPKPNSNWQQKPYTWTFSADPELAKIEQEMVAVAEECLGPMGPKDAFSMRPYSTSDLWATQLWPGMTQIRCMAPASTLPTRTRIATPEATTQSRLKFMFAKLGYPAVSYLRRAEELIEKEAGPFNKIEKAPASFSISSEGEGADCCGHLRECW